MIASEETIDEALKEGRSDFDRRALQLRQFWYIFRKSHTALLGLTIVVIFTVIALVSLFYPLNAYGINPKELLSPPSLQHPFGTDNLGRDIFSRVIVGTGQTLQAALIATTIASVIGFVYGTFSGWFGGKADEAMMRIADLFLALPQFLLVMALTASLGPSLLHATVSVAVINWAGFARIIRAQVLSIKHLPFIEAAKASGASNTRIVFRHIMPNSYSPILVLASLQFAVVILTIAGLSFLGFGAQPPSPELGLMVAQGALYMLTDPWYSLIPGVMILMIALGFNLLGDGLRDALDPFLRRLIS